MIRVLPSHGPADVLRMDALLVTELAGAAARMARRVEASAGGGGDRRDGEWTTDFSGRRTLNIGSMETLSQLLKGQA